MKKIFIVIFVCLFSVTLVAQDEQDVVKLFGGEELTVDVKKLNEKYVFYQKPGERDLVKIDRRLVSEIHYADGKIEVINAKEVDIKVTTDWRKVKLTDNAEDIAGLIELEQIEAVSEGDSRGYYSKRSLENSAKIVLRKKAAMLNADIVLIKEIKNNRAYGDVPSTTIIGVAYKDYSN